MVKQSFWVEFNRNHRLGCSLTGLDFHTGSRTPGLFYKQTP